MLPRLLLVSLLLACCASATSAQESILSRIELNAGLALPQGPTEFKEGWKSGLTLGGAFGTSLGSAFTLLAGLDYARCALDDQAFIEGASDVRVDGGAASSTYIHAGLRVNPVQGPDATFFLQGGGGYYHQSVGDARAIGLIGNSAVGGGSENTFGMHFGAGVQVRRMLVDATYRIGFTEGENTGQLALRLGLTVTPGRR